MDGFKEKIDEKVGLLTSSHSYVPDIHGPTILEETTTSSLNT